MRNHLPVCLHVSIAAAILFVAGDGLAAPPPQRVKPKPKAAPRAPVITQALEVGQQGTLPYGTEVIVKEVVSDKEMILELFFQEGVDSRTGIRWDGGLEHVLMLGLPTKGMAKGRVLQIPKLPLKVTGRKEEEGRLPVPIMEPLQQVQPVAGKKK